jgi:ATP-binding protein involved in chromosome partitioning
MPVPPWPPGLFPWGVPVEKGSFSQQEGVQTLDPTTPFLCTCPGWGVKVWTGEPNLPSVPFRSYFRCLPSGGSQWLRIGPAGSTGQFPQTTKTMTSEELRNDIMDVLATVSSPSGGGSVVAKGQVQDLIVDEDGTARFTFLMAKDDPGSLVKDLRAKVEGVAGVTSAKVSVHLPQSAPPPPPGPGPDQGLKPGSVPAPTPKPGLLPDVGRIIAVSSGKGGVGKSMVATNLATALAMEGKRVGLLDADIYGPNIPLMFGESSPPGVTGEPGAERIAPVEAHGVRLMSLGFMLDKEQPAIMRGPLISGILKQFLEQVAWGALDYMVVDMPPGTGDAQISLVQTIDIDGAVMVTTPQNVSTGDVRRGVRMFEKVNTRVLGIVENMSGYECPHCGEVVEIFGRGGGEELARELDLPFLGRVPLDAAVREAGDAGVPTVKQGPESPAGRALTDVARQVVRILDGES